MTRKLYPADPGRPGIGQRRAHATFVLLHTLYICNAICASRLLQSPVRPDCSRSCFCFCFTRSALNDRHVDPGPLQCPSGIVVRVADKSQVPDGPSIANLADKLWKLWTVHTFHGWAPLPTVLKVPFCSSCVTA